MADDDSASSLSDGDLYDDDASEFDRWSAARRVVLAARDAPPPRGKAKLGKLDAVVLDAIRDPARRQINSGSKAFAKLAELEGIRAFLAPQGREHSRRSTNGRTRSPVGRSNATAHA